jgi:hypothetical protein
MVVSSYVANQPRVVAGLTLSASRASISERKTRGLAPGTFFTVNLPASIRRRKTTGLTPNLARPDAWLIQSLVAGLMVIGIVVLIRKADRTPSHPGVHYGS